MARTILKENNNRKRSFAKTKLGLFIFGGKIGVEENSNPLYLSELDSERGRKEEEELFKLLELSLLGL